MHSTFCCIKIIKKARDTTCDDLLTDQSLGSNIMKWLRGSSPKVVEPHACAHQDSFQIDNLNVVDRIALPVWRR